MTFPRARPAAVLFDWDNTLVDTWPMIHEALHETFAAFGMQPWTIHEVRERVGRSLRDAFPGLFGPRWEEASACYQGHYRRLHLARLRPLEGAAPLLDALRDAAMPMAVVSNKKAVNLQAEVAHLGWGGYFGAVIGSDDAPHDKPHPAPVLLALSRIGAAPGPGVWFVGDTVTDLECAQAAAVTPILYGAHAPETDAEGRLHYRGWPVARHVSDLAALRHLALG